MTYLTKKEKEDFGRAAKIGLTSGASIIVARLAAQKWRNFLLPDVARKTMKGVGTAGMIYGVSAHDKRRDLATHVGGAGLGLTLGSIDTTWMSTKLGETDMVHFDVGARGVDAIDMEVYDIPDWMGRNYGYEKVGALLKKFVLEDTVNKKTGEVIPAGYKHPSVVWLTRNILAERGVSVYDPVAVANAISDWCWENLTYVYDPMTTEAEDFFVHPYLMIKDYTERGFAAGDCDDMAVLVASMLLSVGLTPRFLLWAQEPDSPNSYTHITTALYTPAYRFPNLENTFHGWPYYNIEATMRVATDDHTTANIQGATPGGYNFHPQTFRRGVIVITE